MLVDSSCFEVGYDWKQDVLQRGRATSAEFDSRKHRVSQEILVS